MTITEQLQSIKLRVECFHPDNQITGVLYDILDVISKVHSERSKGWTPFSEKDHTYDALPYLTGHLPNMQQEIQEEIPPT